MGYIKKHTHYFVLFLLLIFPFSLYWKFLIDGRLTNEIIIYEIKINSHECVLCYFVNNKEYCMRNIPCRYMGKENQIKVLYRESNPRHAVIFTFTEIYFNPLFFFSLFLAIIWFVIYYAFRKKEIFPGSSKYFREK